MTSKLLGGITLAVLLGSSTVTAGSLKDIEHVVLFMQENRSWDSVSSPVILISFILLTPYLQYFGTMAGVRGFNDPNVQVNPDGNSVWHQ